MKAIEHLNFYVPVAQYEHEGNTYNALSVSVGYQKGSGFYATYQPCIHKNGMYSYVYDFSQNPLSDTTWVVIKEAPRNSSKEIERMHNSLKTASSDIVYLFDARGWEHLNELIKRVALNGYTPGVEQFVKDLKHLKVATSQLEASRNINNSKNHKDMKLNISNNETKNVANNAQVTNPATAPIVVAKDSKPVPAEEYVEFEEVKEEAPAAAEAVITEPRDNGTQKSQKPQKETAPELSTLNSQLSTVKFSTYTTKKGATAPQIIGFGGETDPRWKKHKDAQSKYVSASYRRDINGNKVYILMFGTRYMDVAKALAGAYNTDDQEAWKRAEDAVVAIYEQAQRDGKAQWEAKKAEWKAKSEEKKAKKEAEKKCYTKEDVAAMLNTLLKGGDVPEDIKKLIKAA